MVSFLRGGVPSVPWSAGLCEVCCRCVCESGGDADVGRAWVRAGAVAVDDDAAPSPPGHNSPGIGELIVVMREVSNPSALRSKYNPAPKNKPI